MLTVYIRDQTTRHSSVQSDLTHLKRTKNALRHVEVPMNPKVSRGDTRNPLMRAGLSLSRALPRSHGTHSWIPLYHFSIPGDEPVYTIQKSFLCRQQTERVIALIMCF